MKTLIPECGDWNWTAGSPGVLLPWFRGGRISGGTLVKRNPRRSVWRVTAGDGKNYYAKLEQRPFWSFRNKAAEEFRASRMLEEAGIPCVHFAACGKNGRSAILVSEAVENAVSAKQFWFETCTADPGKRAAFLEAMRDFLRLLFEKNLRHPDFHAGNILVRRDDCSLLLVDPVGVSFAKSADSLELAHVCVDFLPEIRMEEAEKLASPLGRDPAALVARAKLALLDRVEHEWEKRKAQILSGNSKFSRTVRRDDGRVFEIFSSEWFGERELPRDLASEYDAESMSAADAENRILAMFRARLDGREFSPDYRVREICEDSHILYSIRGK